MDIRIINSDGKTIQRFERAYKVVYNPLNYRNIEIEESATINIVELGNGESMVIVDSDSN